MSVAEAVAAGEHMPQGVALVGAEFLRWYVTVGNGRESVPTGVDRVNQKQLLGENVPRGELRTDTDQSGVSGELFL